VKAAFDQQEFHDRFAPAQAGGDAGAADDVRAEVSLARLIGLNNYSVRVAGLMEEGR
jgi:hypothetical protein